MDRLTATQHIADALKRIDGRTSPWDSSYTFHTSLWEQVYDTFVFLDEINQFPAVCMIPDEERVTHIGHDVRYSNIVYELRGYTLDEDVPEAGENLLDDIEHVLMHFRDWSSEIEEIRINTIETDSGIMNPYGVSILRFLVIFRR